MAESRKYNRDLPRIQVHVDHETKARWDNVVRWGEGASLFSALVRDLLPQLEANPHLIRDLIYGGVHVTIERNTEDGHD